MKNATLFLTLVFLFATLSVGSFAASDYLTVNKTDNGDMVTSFHNLGELKNSQYNSFRAFFTDAYAGKDCLIIYKDGFIAFINASANDLEITRSPTGNFTFKSKSGMAYSYFDYLDGKFEYYTYTNFSLSGHFLYLPSRYISTFPDDIFDYSGSLKFTCSGVESPNLTRLQTLFASIELKMPLYHNLTIHYQYQDGTKAADDSITAIKCGTSYSVKSPSVVGHTPDKVSVSGTMGESDQNVTVTYKKNQSLTIQYKYEDGKAAAATYTADLGAGSGYNVASPKITGYTADRGTVSGTMGDMDINITVTYKRNTHSLMVKYIYKNGLTAAPGVKKILGYGDVYKVVSPKVTGYTADQGAVSGTMGDTDITLTVIYQINVHLLTIHYQYEDGSQAVPDVKKTLDYGAGYHVVSPKITGYTADQGTVSGAIGDADLTITVIYKKYVPPKHTLTIHYQYEDGSEAAPDYIGQIPEGENYSVLSPVVAGFRPDRNTVSGTIGTSDIFETVVYAKSLIVDYVPYNPDSWNVFMMEFTAILKPLIPVLMCLFCVMLVMLVIRQVLNHFAKKNY